MKVRDQKWTSAAWVGTVLGSTGKQRWNHLARVHGGNLSDSPEQQLSLLQTLEKHPWSPHQGGAAHTEVVSGFKWWRHPWDIWVPLGFLPAPWFPGRVAGSAYALEGCHIPDVSGNPCVGEGSPLPRVHPCRDTLARGSACVLLWRQNFDLPSSEKSKVVGRIERGEEVTEHVTTQRYCPPPGNPLNMGEGFLCQKVQPAVFPKGSLGLQVSTHNKEHLIACSAFY